jgi:hypothetical protein
MQHQKYSSLATSFPCLDGNKKLLKQFLNLSTKKWIVWRRKTKLRSLQDSTMMKKKVTASFRVTSKSEATLSPRDGKQNMQNYTQIGELTM